MNHYDDNHHTEKKPKDLEQSPNMLQHHEEIKGGSCKTSPNTKYFSATKYFKILIMVWTITSSFTWLVIMAKFGRDVGYVSIT